MNSKRTIAVVTGSRAEYGLLKPLIKTIAASTDCHLQLIVTGMHLSSEFGLTYREIEADGFPISHKIEMLLSSDSSVGIGKSMGLAMIGFSEVWACQSRPDFVVVLGDRFEVFCAVIAAMVHRLPIAHLHGGEVTEGVIDESIRHSITKMSHLHFTATEEYRRRVIQLGESPERVFTVGAIGIDNIVNLELLDRMEFEKSIGFQLAERNLLITYHPVTLEFATAGHQFGELLQAVDALPATHLIFTKPNADTDGRIIGEMIDAYVQANSHKSAAFTSLGQLRYLSALRHVDGVIGNSSSGIIEAPSLKVGTVNIGDRQRGRLMASSVIQCEADRVSIDKALTKLFSEEFRQNLLRVENPYGRGGVAEKIFDILKNYPLENILKKQFFDLATSGVKNE
jgi:GDP/UDP-N,N'-diacetylbacillosamine 2-epimerase (hydrolysing)